MSFDELKRRAAGEQVHLRAPEVEEVGVLRKLGQGLTRDCDPEGRRPCDEVLLLSER